MTGKSILEHQKYILESYPTTVSRDYYLAPLSIRVQSNNEALFERLDDYFKYFIGSQENFDESKLIEIHALQSPMDPLDINYKDWPRDPGKIGRKDSFYDFENGRACRKVKTGMQYLISDKARIIFGDCLSNDNQVINYINAQQIRELLLDGAVLCHAAGIYNQHGGLGISARSGGGKSTLALHMIRHGFGFVSNDRLLVKSKDGQLSMAGVAKQPRVNPGTLLNNTDLIEILEEKKRKRLLTLPKPELWELEDKYDVDVGDIYGADRVALNTSLNLYAVLDWAYDDPNETKVEQISPENFAYIHSRIAKSPGVFYMNEEQNGLIPPIATPVEHYLPVFKNLPIYRFSGKVDFDFAARFLSEKLGS